MEGIDEVSRLLGQLESSIETLFHKNDNLCKEIKLLNINLQNSVKDLSSSMQKRKLWDTVKVVTGAFLGGFVAMTAKLAIWK